MQSQLYKYFCNKVKKKVINDWHQYVSCGGNCLCENTLNAQQAQMSAEAQLRLGEAALHEAKKRNLVYCLWKKAGRQKVLISALVIANLTQSGLKEKPRDLVSQGWIQGTQTLSSVFRFSLHILILSSFVLIHSQAGSSQVVARMGTMLGRHFYQLSDPRARVLRSQRFPTSLSLNSSLARQMECADYLGLVTCLDHWNRVRSALLKVPKSNLPGSWHGASKTLGISPVVKVSLLFLSPWITPEFMLMRGFTVGP